jgi:hypothetical protein
VPRTPGIFHCSRKRFDLTRSIPRSTRHNGNPVIGKADQRDQRLFKVVVTKKRNSFVIVRQVNGRERQLSNGNLTLPILQSALGVHPDSTRQENSTTKCRIIGRDVIEKPLTKVIRAETTPKVTPSWSTRLKPILTFSLPSQDDTPYSVRPIGDDLCRNERFYFTLDSGGTCRPANGTSDKAATRHHHTSLIHTHVHTTYQHHKRHTQVNK